MASNVMAWKDALAKGYQPGLYPYTEVPLGEYDAVLHFKIWSKKVMAINCYFEKAGTGMKFQVTVYCNETGIYKPGKSDVNFATCEIGRIYKIHVVADQKKKIVFTSAILIG